MYMLLILILIVSFLCIPKCIFAFNLKTHRVLQGPKGTLFGFTARFEPPEMTSNAAGLLVGAPKGKMSTTGIETGQVYNCSNVLDTDDSCSSMEFLKDIQARSFGYTANERFGSSIEVLPSDTILVCSPQFQARRGRNTFIPGRCTLFDLQNMTASALQYPPGTYTAKSYYKGLASYGLSADSKDSVFVIGAPGVVWFQGSIQIRDLNTGLFSDVYREPIATIESTSYGLMGYNVKIGRFCSGSDICVAVGAPTLNRNGMVFLYRWTERKELTLMQALGGPQAWSLFGSVLCAVDADDDGYDELLVGIPFYTEIQQAQPEGLDQGRIFLYGRTVASPSYKFKGTLYGSKSKFSKFGFAMQAVGDVNLDKFQDVAVGAPGEDDGAGCVYIYFGSSSGLSFSHAQRISASQVVSQLPDPIRGFGFAVSNHIVPQNQKYPVFAVTSVESDAVVVMACRAIVDVDIQLKAEPNPVDLSQACSIQDITDTCFVLRTEISFTLRGEQRRPLNFNFTFAIDTGLQSTSSKRAMFRLDDGTLTDSITMEKIRVKSKAHTISHTAVIMESRAQRDRFSPVIVEAIFKLHEEQAKGVDVVLDTLKPQNISYAVTFANDCGSDATCNVDLQVGGAISYTHTGEWDIVVVNHTTEIMVNLEISNNGESSYWTVFTVTVSAALPFSRFKSDVPITCSDKRSAVVVGQVLDDQSVSTNSQNSDTTVMCNYYKPLKKDTKISLSIAFNTENFDCSNSSPLSVTAEAMPKKKIENPEINPDDNKAFYKSPVSIIVDMSVAGSSSPSEVALKEAKKLPLNVKEDVDKSNLKSSSETEKIDLNHKVLVRNLGPSFLPKTSILVNIPMFLPDGTQLVLEADVTLSAEKGQLVQCEYSSDFDRVISPHATTTTTTPKEGGEETTQAWMTQKLTTETTTSGDFEGIINKRRKRGAKLDSIPMDNIYVADCQSSQDYCIQFVCDLPLILNPGRYAEVNVSMVLDKGNIPIPEGFETFWFVTQTQVVEPSHPLFKPWQEVPEHQTLTTFHLLNTSEELNIWIIIGSIIAGLVLIIVIVVVLWKVGFFKRDKHYQVQKWRRESQRRSRREKTGGPPPSTDPGPEVGGGEDS